MPWSAQLDNYYNYFGNGYVPYFAVIGADYEYVYGSNNVSGALNAAENAIENMVNISVIVPIDNVFMDANTSTTINIDGTFLHSQGADMTYSITGNTNPDCCEATLTGSSIFLDASVVAGITNITVTATDGNITGSDEFLVTVNDIYPVPVNPTGVTVYPQVIISWQEPDATLPISGYNVFRDDDLVANLGDEQFSFLDEPGEGDFVYTIKTQYIFLQSGPSDPVYISLVNTPGDVDGSDVIDCFDASLVLFYAAGISHPIFPLPWDSWRIERADIDGNGTVEAYDCSLILQYIVQIIDEL